MEQHTASQITNLVVWFVSDGKPGHENQTRGLIHALGDLIAVESITIPQLSLFQALRAVFTRQLPTTVNKDEPRQKPDLIIGAGHSTHLTLLMARHISGGRCIVLMKPSLPRQLFDLCLIPEHDGIGESNNIITTRGAINTIQPSNHHDDRCGLILVGGPSKHHGWNEPALLQHIQQLITQSPEINWTLADSRRTPAAGKYALSQLSGDNIHYQPAEKTESNWLPEKLANSAHVWVTEDSMSMIYEALTSGSYVGVIPVPRLKQDRIIRAVSALIESGMVNTPGTNRIEQAEHIQPLNEAKRCAQIMIDRWFN